MKGHIKQLNMSAKPEEEDQTLTSLLCAAWDSHPHLNYGTLYVGWA